MTGKQQRFIDAYLGEANLNATAAARIAGYAKPMQQGHETKSQPDVAAEISRRLAEATLAPGEVLNRLSDHARGSLEPFLSQAEDDSIRVDITSEQAKAHLHLLKKVKVKRRTGGKADEPWEEIETEIELHDPQAALRDIGRHYKLFTDRVEHDFTALTDEELDRQIEVAAAEGGEAP